jgi:SOS response regulatory protein OraA/RecX
MKIISIFKSDNLKDRYRIKTDDGLFFNISKKLLEDINICLDKTISSIEKQKIIEDEFSYLKYYSNKYFKNYISSKNNFKQKLFEKGFSKFNINNIINHNIETGNLNDEKYSDYLVQSLINRKKYSKREIFHKLLKKKIDKNIINELLEKYYTDDVEKEILNNVIDKNKKKYTPQKLKYFLFRKGFSC